MKHFTRNKTLIPFISFCVILVAWFSMRDRDIVFRLPSGEKWLSGRDWKAMENSDTFAKNFQAKRKLGDEVFPQIITYFLLDMRSDQKIGRKISETEYLEFFVLHPESITMQVRRQCQGYWIMSRQTFCFTRRDWAVHAKIGDTFDDLEVDKLSAEFDWKINRTRNLLAMTI